MNKLTRPRIVFFISAVVLGGAVMACGASVSPSSSASDDRNDASFLDGSSDARAATNDSGASSIIDAGTDADAGVISTTNNCSGETQSVCFNAGSGFSCPAEYPSTLDCCNGYPSSDVYELNECQEGGPTVVGDNSYYCCQAL